MMDLHWSIKPFDELTLQELYDLLRLRTDVFVVEQNCPYAEVDGLDPTAIHVLARDVEGGMVACSRILPPDTHGLPHIGRVVVRADLRGVGIASELMERSLSTLHRAFGSRRSGLAAQAHLEQFYARFGYLRQGPNYLLDGIPHVDMLLNQ